MNKEIFAGVLNVLIPGAGMAYLKQWKSALAYFFLVPIFLIGSSFTLNLMSGSIIDVNGHDISLGSVRHPIIWAALFLVAVGVVIWDAFRTAYQFAKGETREHRIVALTVMSLLVPGLGFVPMKKWGYAVGYVVWAPLGLILGSYAFGAVFSVLARLFPTLPNAELITAVLASLSAKALVIWESAYYTYQASKKMAHVKPLEGISMPS